MRRRVGDPTMGFNFLDMRILLFLAVVGTEGLIIVTTVECAQGSEA